MDRGHPGLQKYVYESVRLVTCVHCGWFQNLVVSRIGLGLYYFARMLTAKPTNALVTKSKRCPKCAINKKSGRVSCCARGGAWFKNCGDAGDANFDHTWVEGIQACKSTFLRVCAVQYVCIVVGFVSSIWICITNNQPIAPSCLYLHTAMAGVTNALVSTSRVVSSPEATVTGASFATMPITTAGRFDWLSSG